MRVAVSFIRRFPEAAPHVGAGVRRKLFRRPFEYAVWYSVDDKGVIIWAIGHLRREPEFWRNRTADSGAA
jgi:hypothetical protein